MLRSIASVGDTAAIGAGTAIFATTSGFQPAIAFETSFDDDWYYFYTSG